MQYIIIGLGYFGATLAARLTALGHEVIGIDRHPDRGVPVRVIDHHVGVSTGRDDALAPVEAEHPCRGG